MARDVDAYVRELDTVRGWLSPTDARLLRLADAAQRSAGVTGDILEIGAYEGKSAILLGFLARPGEEVVVCDLFDQAPADEANRAESAYWYPDLSRSAFEANYVAWHGRLPTIVAQSSTELGRLGWPARFRLVHVDGAHTHDVVRADVATSRQLSVDGAIAVFDDYRREGLPGVAAAVWAAVADNGLVPVCLSGAKLYATWAEPDSALCRTFREHVRQSGLPVDNQPINGHEVLCVSASADQGRLARWVPPALVPMASSARAAVRRAAAAVEGRRGRR